MIDVKKLVFGFLILAVAVGASAFIVEHFGSASASAANATAIVAQNTAAQSAAANSVGANAFATQTPTDDTGTQIYDDDPAMASETAAIASDPTNLTNLLAASYVTGLVASNPNGASDDGSGDTSLTAPDPNAVLAMFSNESGNPNIVLPDWDAEADQIPIITETNSSSSLANYSAAIQQIFNQDFVQTNLESVLAGSSDPTETSYAAGQIQTALQDIGGLKTPQSAVAFQKSLLKMLVYEKGMLTLVENDSVDPLKTALTVQGEDQNYDAVVQNFQNQATAITALKGFIPIAAAPAPAQNGIVAFVDHALGIQTAQAQWTVFDPSNFAQTIKAFVENLALQILKEVIIGLMQRQVLSFIRGSGAPRFIQNWGTTLVNAGVQSAIGAINSQYQCMSASPFAGQIKLNLNAFYSTANNACVLQFNQVLGGTNLTRFYNNFANGGWLTFGQTMQPDNNYYGSMFFAAQVVANTSQNAVQATQAKSISNQGWTGKEVCLDPTNGSSIDPFTGCKPGDALNPGPTGGTCIAAGGKTYAAASASGGGACPAGSNQMTLQPGQITNQVFNSAVDSSGKLVAGSNAITGLLNAFLSSLLSTIAQSTLSLTGTAINSIGSAGSSSGGNNGGATTNPTTGLTSIQLVCNVTSGVLPNPGGFILSAQGGNTVSAAGIESTPSYVWQVTSGVATQMSGAGPQFETTFATPGTYNILLNDTADATSTNCVVTF